MTCHIIHEPLLDPYLHVMGYKIAWHQEGQPIPADEEMEAMLRMAAEDLFPPDNTWPLGDKPVFLQVVPGLLSSDSLKAFSPGKIVFSIDGSSLWDGAALDALTELRRLGFGISIANLHSGLFENELLAHVTHLEVDCSRSNADAIVQIAQIHALFPQVQVMGRNIDSWNEYFELKPHGLNVLAGDFYLEMPTSVEKRSLSPTQGIILKCMDLLTKNADVGEIEKELKRDPAITYQLLRYMNTVGHGDGIDFSSLRQAVNYLGYSNLNKWLCCLLAMSSTSASASPVLETAMFRGIFMELLGRLRKTRNKTDQMFIAGIFSLLDILLCVPMEELLAEIRLSEPIKEALLTGSGIYGRYLELARACEYRHGLAAPIAESLRINVNTANAAHLRAIACVQRIK